MELPPVPADLKLQLFKGATKYLNSIWYLLDTKKFKKKDTF